jgi:hypothetical protein
MLGKLITGLTTTQLEIIEGPPAGHIFLEGPAGCGKTTTGVERLARLLESGVRGDSLLVLVPQRALGKPYYDVLHTPGLAAGGLPDVVTIGGLARRMVELFWPLAAEKAGFAHPEAPPTFLTLETAQYYMAHLVRPKLAEGFFETVVIDRNRLYSQIIDNLNKAALNDFDHTEIGERLKSAWVGEISQLRVYDDAQQCANIFRQYCLEHNLLDFSLQVEIFYRLLWQAEPLCQQYLKRTYHHLIADNIEENPPVAHQILQDWLPDFDSALLIFDQQAGYRVFLGADPGQASELRRFCERQVLFSESFITNPSLKSLEEALQRVLQPEKNPALPASLETPGDPSLALSYSQARYYPQMLDDITDRIADLIAQGTPAGEIVVLAPFLSDSLRYSLTYRLEAAGIPARAYRPSRALRDEPATLCLLSLAAIAHPDWQMSPRKEDFTLTLLQALDGLDLVRARLLADSVYRLKEGKPVLESFAQLPASKRERITYRIGEVYDRLRDWLENAASGPVEPLDHFIARLFGELLSQPGFGFHADYKAAEVTANLIESVQKFRWVAGEPLQTEGIPLGREYLQMVQDGVIAATYVHSFQEVVAEAVFLSPAHTFLMQNRPVEYQFWLEIGSRNWFERISQPLTHPYVLSRRWEKGRSWTQSEEERTSRESMTHLVTGLIRRCRGQIHLGLSQLNEQGFESRGPLLHAFDRLLRNLPEIEGGPV